MQRKGLRRFFLRGQQLHPLWRAAIYLVGFLVAELSLDLLVVLAYVGALLLTGRSPMDALSGGLIPRPVLLGVGVARLGAALGLALLLGRFLDREPAETMGFARARLGRDTAAGLALGLGTMLLIGGVKLGFGWATPARGAQTAGTFLLEAAALLPLAMAEEVAFRAYLQRALTTWKGPLVGVSVTSLLFAMFHILNPEPSLLAIVNIALAGAVFALAVEWSGTLWLAAGYHFAWNLAQGPLLGMPVSGMPWDGLWALGTGGPPLLTGGSFGPEGGLLATGVLFLSLLPLWAATRRPATLVTTYRRQRARVEARSGPLPFSYHRLDIDRRLFDDVARAIKRGDRHGEVVLLLRRADGSVLMHTKSFYPSGAYRLPSGGIRRGELVMAAAARESGEETGLNLQESCPLGVVTYRLRAGHRRLFFHSWLILGEVEGEASASDIGERIADFRWIPADRLPQMAAELRALPPEWSAWGNFRALAHDAAARWFSGEGEPRPTPTHPHS
jgi:membrane protease YdiL (CAAX protease family)/8-oxo-dGTP pyrophosphatase MutT (NUDIX family)